MGGEGDGFLLISRWVVSVSVGGISPGGETPPYVLWHRWFRDGLFRCLSVGFRLAAKPHPTGYGIVGFETGGFGVHPTRLLRGGLGGHLQQVAVFGEGAVLVGAEIAGDDAGRAGAEPS